MLEKQSVGQLGEEIAAKYLKNKGFSILDRNFRRPWGELDIVTEKDGILHFVEVKSVSYENKWFSPSDLVHTKKKARLAKIIDTYLENKDQNIDWQVDVIEVFLDQKTKKARANLIENIELV